MASLHAQALSLSASTTASTIASPLALPPGTGGSALDLNGTGVNGTNGTEETSPSIVSKSLRRKRAREARDAREAVSESGSSERFSTPLSTPTTLPSGSLLGSGNSQSGLGAVGKSSKSDPEFYKLVTDRFQAVGGVEWLGEGEVVVVERPFGDFVGQLPAQFWTGSFGRA